MYLTPLNWENTIPTVAPKVPTVAADTMTQGTHGDTLGNPKMQVDGPRYRRYTPGKKR